MTTLKIPYEVENSDLRNDFFHRILPTAINSLNRKHQARWGKMSSQHMVEHLRNAFRMSTGEIQVECNLPKEKRAKLQTFLDTNRPMAKGITNPVIGNTLPDLRLPNLTEAKDALNNERLYFIEYYQQEPTSRNTHPLFGELDKEKWQKFHFKHCFHHLTQFGLITEKVDTKK